MRLTKSPILNSIQESMNGASTIRVYGRTAEFIQNNNKLLDTHLKAVYVKEGVSTWFALRIDMLSILLMAVISLACVLLREDQDQTAVEKADMEPILLSILLSYVLNIQSTLVWVLKYYVQIESNMINAERCMKLATTIQEKDTIGDKVAELTERPNWPEEGKLSFQGVTLRYRPTTEIALNQLSFTVKPREKIGIVGRTGAGKSTIGLALSRIVELLKG